ncbi:sporulation protein YabP [Salipaludibacillus neizhouensis]|uniref:Sporulation protein YabP n=1 Tax=Salipaludibacillus neizhouensis TaxID=885475 RepID=A0A3A9JXK5_9BACI|nr:sporulation protein YabP [Salipaludibacillus neizhouensis]RKL65217.1 sporulation protein YabP [Salipaludibacillus neizhouensis]
MEQPYDYMQKGQGPKTREHKLMLRSRKTLDISGVKQVESFDSEEFLLETEMGFLSIRGHNLQMKNLDVEEGNVSIQGQVDDLVYLDQQNSEKSKGLFGKLFK